MRTDHRGVATVAPAAEEATRRPEDCSPLLTETTMPLGHSEFFSKHLTKASASEEYRSDLSGSICERQHVPTVVHRPVLNLAQKTLPEQPCIIVADRAGNVAHDECADLQ